ncbi:serine/threonine-protein kinase [Streptomyces sp. NPDC006458]|uniref:serine/threonine-protein kinase n=1 Tax=Streptomyces sp. NPDC006458 TaxID=3154302 RepID=UPI0033B5AAB1
MEKLGAGDPLRIGAYRLLARLGAGGMGQVYLARSDRGRTVAVKLVKRDLAAQEEFRERFRQEVRAAQRVGGYWTAPVLDADTEAEVPWVATGYVAGPSLQQVVGRDHGALPERSVRILAAGLAHALKDIHAAGIVHRDLKPSNVLVTIDGPRVIDFGIARALETVTEAGLTRTGALIGSPGFMAPEQVRGDRITPACDVFCLGSVLAYAATGTLPFGGADSGVHALMFRIAQDEPDLTGVPEGIADLVRDCLKKDPGARPTLDRILQRTGAEDTVSGGRSRDPWLPGALVAQLGRHAVQLLDTEDPELPGGAGAAHGAPGAPVAPGPAGGAWGPGGAGVPPGASGVPALPAAPALPALPGRFPAGAPGAPAAPGHPPVPGAPQAGPSGVPAALPPVPGAPPAGAPGVPAPGIARPALPALPAASPEHAPAGDESAPAFGPPPGTPPDRLPTVAAGPGPQGGPPHPAYAPPPAYGHPQPGPDGYAYGTARPGAGGWGAPPAAPAWGGSHQPGAAHGGLGSTLYGPPSSPPERRNGWATPALVAVALVVALAAGGSVYALMNGGLGDDAKGGPTPSPVTTAPTTSGPTTDEPTPSTSTSSGPTSSAPADGVVPEGYVGTWTAAIDNDSGHNTRVLTIRQGEVGDTVLSLVAEGPSGSGTYRCVFEARLGEEPGTDGPLAIGPSTVTVGEPASSCTPGAASEVTLLPDGTLRRVNTDSGEELTYRRG